MRPYAFGESADETARLDAQGQLFNNLTAAFLTRAGLREGMRVLEIGCGAGDVTLIAARLVGPSGAVVGVDSSAERLDVARRRSSAHPQIALIRADAHELEPDVGFDAIIGRCVLVHNPDPAGLLRQLSRSLKPDGIVAFEEPAHRACPPHADPPSPLLDQAWDYVLRAYANAGIRMGLRLIAIFRDAGLPTPITSTHAAAGAGPNWAGYDYIQQHLQIMTPLFEQAGLDVDALDPPTFAERLRAETNASNGALTTWGFVTAHTRLHAQRAETESD